jgi:protein involved in polysaccharide export with SLBB domain
MVKSNLVYTILILLLLVTFSLGNAVADTDTMTLEILPPDSLAVPPSYSLPASSSPIHLKSPSVTTDPPGFMGGYKLGAGDKLKITVFGESDLSGTFAVNEEGYISMPLIGNIHVGEKTPGQVGDTITARLADGYLVEPSVAIEVAEYRPVYIMGEVRMPGSYPFVADMTVRNAVAIAGGFTYRANEKSMTVLRQDNQNSSRKTELGPDDNVQPGDIITIRERFF